jgi:hypothetical protein
MTSEPPNAIVSTSTASGIPTAVRFDVDGRFFQNAKLKVIHLNKQNQITCVEVLARDGARFVPLEAFTPTSRRLILDMAAKDRPTLPPEIFAILRQAAIDNAARGKPIAHIVAAMRADPDEIVVKPAELALAMEELRLDREANMPPKVTSALRAARIGLKLAGIDAHFIDDLIGPDFAPNVVDEDPSVESDAAPMPIVRQRFGRLRAALGWARGG